jgi:hypothetical protein
MVAAFASMLLPVAACDGSSELLTLVDWSAVKGTFPNSAVVTARYRNDGDHAIRLVDASLSFSDVLGQPIGLGIKIGPELVVEADGVVAQNFTALGWGRLAEAAPEDVVGAVCLRAAVLADGSKTQF